MATSMRPGSMLPGGTSGESVLIYAFFVICRWCCFKGLTGFRCRGIWVDTVWGLRVEKPSGQCIATHPLKPKAPISRYASTQESTALFCSLTLCCTKTDTITRHDTHFCCEGHQSCSHEGSRLLKSSTCLSSGSLARERIAPSGMSSPCRRHRASTCPTPGGWAGTNQTEPRFLRGTTASSHAELYVISNEQVLLAHALLYQNGHYNKARHSLLLRRAPEL